MSTLPSDITYYGAFSMPGYDGATTISAAITTTTATSISITSAATFPQSGEFPILIDSEMMWVTQGAGTTTWTVIRGMGGTTAATHLINANVTSPSGGSVDFLTRVAFSDIVSGHTMDAVSSSASDTFQIMAVSGRDTTGNLQLSKTGTLTGTTPVVGLGASQAFDRLLYVGLSSGTTIATTALTAGATTIATAGHANFPTSGNYYIQMGKELAQVTAGQNTNSWTVTRGVLGTTATTHQVGDNIYLLPFGDVAVYDHTPAINTHTAQTGSANSVSTTPALMKLQAGDGSAVSIGQIIRTTGGTGPNQIRYITAITGYGTDVVAVNRDWGTVPDSTTTYVVLNGFVLDLVAGSGVGATVPNQVTGVQRSLWGATAQQPGGSQVIFYEKVFVVNNNAVTAGLSASVQIASNTPALPTSPTALLDIALTNVLNDVGFTANRQTVPGSGIGSFVTQPSAVAVIASPGSLPPGAAPNAAGAQGVWERATLPAGTAAYKGGTDLRTLFNTI